MYKMRSKEMRFHQKLHENLMLRVPLKDTMRMILNTYWDPPKTVLDVTAGERKIWGNEGWYNNKTLDGAPARWTVLFNDKSTDSKADYHFDFREMNLPDDFVDIIVVDVPFTPEHNLTDIAHPDWIKNERNFYAHGFIEPKTLFAQSKNEFNRLAREGLIVKIQDRHDDSLMIPQHVHAIQEYSLKFQLVDIVHYRGNRPVTGRYTKLPFSNTTVSYYLIFKKNRFRR
jgi:hypothetical protein